MNWLAALWKATLEALLNWGQKNAEQPKPITHAETPPAKLEQFQDDIERFKQRKNDEEQAKNPPINPT